MKTRSRIKFPLQQRVRQIRKRAGLTQDEAAQKAGISYIYYQSIEGGRRPNVSLWTLEKLAGAFGLKLHELVAPVVPRLPRNRAVS